MFEFAGNFTEMLGAVQLVLWAVSGYRIGRLVYRRTPAALRRSVRRQLVQLGVNALVAAAQVTLGALSWSVDWSFASNRVVLALPVLVAPAVLTAVWTVPRLRRLALVPPDIDSVALSARVRAAAWDPRLVVPVQATAAGALLDFWVVFVERPVPPYAGHLVVLWTVLLAACGLLWLRHRRRQRVLNENPTMTGAGGGTRVLRVALAIVAVGAVAAAVISYGVSVSRLPARMNMTSMHNVDWGGGQAGSSHHHHPLALAGHATTSVTDLTGPTAGTPDVRFTLIAQEQRIRLASGAAVDGWTFNGQAPGPELRVHQGDLVEVTLTNHLRREGVTIHWHGLDVPNAMDGVAGVTQDAVQPGQSFTYRFRPKQVGTYWYHSHQVSEDAVDRGLFGALVVLPRQAPVGSDGVDLTVMAHVWTTGRGQAIALDTWNVLRRQAVRAGSHVRPRLVNTSDDTTEDAIPRSFMLSGTPFTVEAIDGTDLNGPGALTNVRLEIAIGGRYDLAFTMPDHPVRLTDLTNPSGGLLLSPDGTGTAEAPAGSANAFDPIRYGRPAPTPFGPSGPFDRRFTVVLDDRLGFYDGQFNFRPHNERAHLSGYADVHGIRG